MTEPQTQSDAKRPRAKPNKAKLTRPFITRWKRKPPAETTTWWHTGLAGFGVAISPGGSIVYRVRYNVGRGRHGRTQRQLALPGTLPPDEAERQARRDAAANGVNLTTYEALVELFIEGRAKPGQRTWDQTRRVLLGPTSNPYAWLKMPLKDSNEVQLKSQVRARLRQLIAGGHPDQARNLKAWLATLFKWAAGEDIITRSFMSTLQIDIEKRNRPRVYSDDEMKATWQAADQLSVEEGTFVKLVMLLAPRKIALAAMASGDLDSLNAPTVWTTPHKLTKSRKLAEERVYITPLPAMAQRQFKRIAKQGRLFSSLPVHSAALAPAAPKSASRSIACPARRSAAHPASRKVW